MVKPSFFGRQFGFEDPSKLIFSCTEKKEEAIIRIHPCHLWMKLTMQRALGLCSAGPANQSIIYFLFFFKTSLFIITQTLAIFRCHFLSNHLTETIHSHETIIYIERGNSFFFFVKNRERELESLMAVDTFFLEFNTKIFPDYLFGFILYWLKK